MLNKSKKKKLNELQKKLTKEMFKTFIRHFENKYDRKVVCHLSTMLTVEQNEEIFIELAAN